jgi:hypothetical protein
LAARIIATQKISRLFRNPTAFQSRVKGVRIVSDGINIVHFRISFPGYITRYKSAPQ